MEVQFVSSSRPGSLRLALWQICQHKPRLLMSIAADGSPSSLLSGDHMYKLSTHKTEVSFGLHLDISRFWHKPRRSQWLERGLLGVQHLFQRRVRPTQWRRRPGVVLSRVRAGEEGGKDGCLSSGHRERCVCLCLFFFYIRKLLNNVTVYI